MHFVSIDKIRANTLLKLTSKKKSSLSFLEIPDRFEVTNPKKDTQQKTGQSLPLNETEIRSSEDELFQLEPKTRQQIKIVGRTLFCFRCEGSKEMASYYCACGSFLCTLHLAEHSCLVSASMQYNEELLEALC